MIYVTKIYMPDKEKFKSYIDGIYKSGWLTNNGPLVQELEKKLEEYLGVKNLLCISSGTDALQFAYRLLESDGKEVITTPFSFVSTTSAIVAERLIPKFADIDRETYNIDPKNIEKLINKNTSAIAPCHVFGNACDIEKIDEIAKKHDLKVIYDASHAFDVKYKGEHILNYGDISGETSIYDKLVINADSENYFTDTHVSRTIKLTPQHPEGFRLEVLKIDGLTSGVEILNATNGGAGSYTIERAIIDDNGNIEQEGFIEKDGYVELVINYQRDLNIDFGIAIQGQSDFDVEAGKLAGIEIPVQTSITYTKNYGINIGNITICI